MSNEREGLREVLREIAAEAWRARDEAEEAIAFEAGESRILSILTQAQEPVGYVVVYDNGKGDRDIHHGELWDYAEDAQMAADAMNGARNGFTYTVEPVNASPVASAPQWPEPGAPAPATKPPLGKIRPSAPEEEWEAFDPLTCLPGEYEIGRAIREVANHDPERMRFYLTCSIGELAQRIARLRATQREGGEG